ncbi:unnamed protein product [Lota lota]
MSVTSWFLVSSSGTRHRLPREMIFVGRDDCELMLQSRSVDKQHAVINYDPITDEHMVKDLGSLNGTFVNDLRIPDQTYITLKLSDLIRFGYDILSGMNQGLLNSVCALTTPPHVHVYILERSQHKVPEEALKHEKYTSQLQLGLKALEAMKKEKPQPHISKEKHRDTSNGKTQDRVERKAYSATAATDSPISKPTPLYGQPSWWGEDEDPDNKQENGGGKQPDQESTEPARDLSREGVNGSLSESTGKAVYSYRREPSYFEIPTRESQQRAGNTPEEGVVQEVPTKDIPAPAPCVPSTPTPPVVQSHASFTIEFDECTPGKMKIKDHITKFSLRQQRKFPPKETAAAPSEVVSAESKVADWLVQSNASMMMRRRSHAEDEDSTQSDQSAQKTTKGHRHEDGTHSDSDRPSSIVKGLIQAQALIGSPVSQPPQKGSPPQRSSPNHITPPNPDDPLSSVGSQSPPTLGKSGPHQPFLSDNLMKRSQSFVNNTSPAEASAQPGNTRKAAGAGGERQVSSSASSTPVSQRYTVPLKNHDAAPGPVRAGSLRREKTEYPISTSFSSRSTTYVSVRPFGSVGRRSKLAQDYTAEFLKRTTATAADHWQKTPSGSTQASPPRTAASPASPPWSPPGTPSPPAPYPVQASSPIHQPVPLSAPLMPRASQGAVDKPPPRGPPRPDEDDTLSDAGTYTIEDEAQDKEVEEARSMIDQVFGVLESPEQSQQTEADTSAAYRPDSIECMEQHRQSSSEVLGPCPEQGEGLRAPVSQGAPKWMSRWASLADSYTESQPSPGLVNTPSQMEQPGEGGITTFHNTALGNESDSSRTLRVLPKVPLREKGDTPSSRVRYDLQSTFEVVETSSTRTTVQDDLDPDSLSDASRSDHSSVVETRRTPPVLDTTQRSNVEHTARLPAKSTSFYVGSEEDCGGSGPCTPKTERKPSPKLFSTATLTKQRGTQDAGKPKPHVSAPLLEQGRTRSPSSPESRHGSSASLIRQESFTKECPSNTRLPNISSKPASREPEPEDESPGAFDQDTHSYLKDTEDLLASMEAKLHAFQPSVAKPPSAMDSLSGESDIDTSSTVSHHSNKPNSLSTQNAVPTNGIHRERSSASMASQDSNPLSSASEHLSERPNSRGGSGRKERGPVGLRRSASRCGSVDLSDDAQGSSLPCSDQEAGGHHPGRKHTVPLKKDDAKPSKAAQALSRSSSLSAPRATRASVLRRARLGDASDNEASETDKLAKEAASKQSKEAKKFTRLDMLAMPRKRTGSFNSPSDTEASVFPPVSGRTTGFSNRSTESSSGSTRKASVSGPKPAPQKGALTKTPIARGRSSSAKYTSSTASSRRRQMGCDYASTSEDECDVKDPSTAKHTHNRSQPSPARNSSVTRARSRPPPQALVALRPKRPGGRDSEEESHDGETFHSWSNHSAEIARLSQDLAKDLAILAREIHDVAGEATEAQVPASTVTACEELVQHVPEAGLNCQRGPPSPVVPKDLDQSPRDHNTGDHEPNSTSQPRNREEVIVDRLMLNPVTQISLAIRENTDQLTEKLKVLFQDRMDVWEEVEAKITRDNNIPIVKTSNKEITSILNELRRVQRQLEVINSVMEPNRKREQDKSSSSTRPTAAARSSRPDARDWRTTHSALHRGGGYRPSESVRRAAVTPDDARDGYVV